MTPLKTIVTHPGGAHKDDFLACAVLLTHSPARIERRDPTEDDLADPAVAVADIGHRYDLELSNFDHHQFPRDNVPTCALSLVLQRFGIYEDAREFCDWLEVAEWFDCRGANDTASWLGIERDTLGRLNSPIDITILRRFASQSEHRPGEPVWEIMRMIGEDLVAFVGNMRARLDFVALHAEVWTLGNGGGGEFKALFMPRTDPMPDEASAGLAAHVEALGLEKEVAALIYPDSRGGGYGLRRYNDDRRLDFSRIDCQDDVHFTHARGFIAKTSADCPDRLKALAVMAFAQPA